MNEELRARFLPRFIDTAKGRLAKLAELLAHRNEDGVPKAVRLEFHSLAGEASMLGLAALGEDARGAENAAAAWMDGDAKAMMTCLRALRPLGKSVAALAAPAAPAAPVPDADEPGTAPAATGMRVLVVDDSAINADAVVDALEDVGIVARSASDLAGVTAVIKELDPQLILSDVHMPNLALTTLIAHIRELSDADVFLLSGLSEEELAGLEREVRADGYLSKEAGLAALVQRVQSVPVV